jgi:hypothetical protein
MLARVKQDYAAGPVRAFSGREYVREEWREVPAGFEEQALTNPLLDTQPSLDEIRAESSSKPGLGKPESEPEGESESESPAAVTAVTDEPPAPTEPAAPVPTPDAQAAAAEAGPAAEDQQAVAAETAEPSDAQPSVDNARDENASLPGLGTAAEDLPTPATETDAEKTNQSRSRRKSSKG